MATDVAGRGIDIKDVSVVINYDMAKSIEGGFFMKKLRFLFEEMWTFFFSKKKILLLDFARSSNGLAKFGSSSPFSNDIVLFVIMIF